MKTILSKRDARLLLLSYYENPPRLPRKGRELRVVHPNCELSLGYKNFVLRNNEDGTYTQEFTD